MQPKLLFVTDPLCAWCWGTLPELEAARRQLGDEVEFDLIMAGMRVGTDEGLAEYNRRRLLKLWREVRQVTGQVFAEQFPADDFVFDSARACRAIELARHDGGGPPWEFFSRLQAAFFVDARDTGSIDVLADLLELDAGTVAGRVDDPQYAAAVEANVDLIERLSAQALPNIQLDVGDGYRLLSGGYISSDFLIDGIRERMAMACRG